MRKPNGYQDAASYTGDFERMEPGAYICKIKNVREETSNGIWKLSIAFDVAEGPLAGIFGRQYDRFGDKWPFGGTYQQPIEGKDGKCNPFFKGMITAIEESNPGFSFDFNNEKCLVGKLFGAIFGEEEYVHKSSGELRTSCKCVQIRSVKSIRDGAYKIPDRKLYNSPPEKSVNLTGFEDFPPEECPF